MAPPVDYVYEMIKLMASPKGMLLVNNYTSDRMAFEMAQAMAPADGLRVETVIIDNDVDALRVSCRRASAAHA